MSGARHDVVVLGGGPAGSAAATLLAGHGHNVALLRLDRPPAAALPESIPPSARRTLDELGMLSAVEAAGFHANRGNVAWWAGDAERRERFSATTPGFHVERGALESTLVDVARRAGARVHDGVRARSGEPAPNGWTVRADGPAGGRAFEAPWVIDATGRSGVLARPQGRHPDRSTTTLALVRRWRRAGGWPEAVAHHTLVESYADGWAWSVPLAEDVRCFTAMIDQREVELSGLDVDEMLERELARTSHVGIGRKGAIPDGPAWACPASLYTASSFAKPGLLLAGDAGSFIDPLSSFGVKKALSSGWLAAVAVHTALMDPAAADIATDFFDARERDVYRRYRSISTAFFESAAEHHRTDYWRRRAESARRACMAADAETVPDDGTAPDLGTAPAIGMAPAMDVDAGTDLEHLHDGVPEAAVRRAFEAIRARPSLDAVPGRTLRMVERPGVVGHRIVLRDHLVSDQHDGGLRHVRGVDLRELVAVAPLHTEVPDGWAAYNARSAPVTLPDYLTALATAFAAGFLEHGDR